MTIYIERVDHIGIRVAELEQGECPERVTCGPSQTDRFGSVAGESGSSRREGPELGVDRTILAALETNANSQYAT